MSRKAGRIRILIPLVLALLGVKVLVLVAGLSGLSPKARNGVFEMFPSASANPADAQEPRGVDEFLREIQDRRLRQLQEREAQIRSAEAEVQSEQLRLEQVRTELTSLMEEIKELQSEVDRVLTEREETELETLKRLARVYEETPPEKAGPMLSELSPRMAAKILLHINPRKAGKIWGEVSPERARLISKELVRKEE